MSLRPGAWIAFILIRQSGPGEYVRSGLSPPHASRAPCDDPTVTTHVASGPTQTRPLVLTRSNSGTGTADADRVWEAKRQFLTQAAHAPSKVGKRLVREDRDSRVLRFPRTDSGASRFPPPSGLIFVHPSLKGSVMRITCRWNGPSCSLRIHPSSSRRQAASV